MNCPTNSSQKFSKLPDRTTSACERRQTFDELPEDTDLFMQLYLPVRDRDGTPFEASDFGLQTNARRSEVGRFDQQFSKADDAVRVERCGPGFRPSVDALQANVSEITQNVSEITQISENKLLTWMVG